MEGSATTRIVLFAAVSAMLVGAPVVFSRGSNSIGTEGAVHSEPVATGPEHELVARLEQEQGEVEAASRRFLTAFLRYEVGDQSPNVRATLHETATTEFARQLLGSPTRPTVGRFPPQAVLHSLDVEFVSPEGTLALVRGTALRARLPEEFAFLFALRPSGWLASGPAE